MTKVGLSIGKKLVGILCLVAMVASCGSGDGKGLKLFKREWAAGDSSERVFLCKRASEGTLREIYERVLVSDRDPSGNIPHEGLRYGEFKQFIESQC